MQSDERALTPLALWAAVDELLRRATIGGILAHKLGPLAAHRLRRLGEPLPEEILREERAATMCMLLARPLLERVRSICDGSLVLIKGPEVALLYPARARRFSDLDVLSQDAERAQRALVAHGLTEAFDPALTPEWHHLQRLKSNIGLHVEIHKAPRWPSGRRPRTQEIFEASIPAAVEVEGVATPTPVHHALLLAIHAWDHEPLWTLRDLIDVAAMSEQADERELNRTAAAWEIDRLWRSTQRVVDAAFYGGRRPIPVRIWARHLEKVRDRTGLDGHLTQVFSGYSALRPLQALAQTARALRNIFGPNPEESWREKLRRVPQSLRKLRATVDRSDEATPATTDQHDRP